MHLCCASAVSPANFLTLRDTADFFSSAGAAMEVDGFTTSVDDLAAMWNALCHGESVPLIFGDTGSNNACTFDVTTTGSIRLL